MRRGAWIVGLVLASSAFADTEPRFAKLRDSADRLSGLGAFLEKFVGECERGFGEQDCEAGAREFRKKNAGKRFYMIVSESDASMLSMGGYDPRGAFTLNVIPFFTARGLGLTHGAPKRTDARGNPILPLIQVREETPEGLTGPALQRLFSTRQLRLQVVFVPQDVWSLPKKGGGKIKGVRARILGLLVTHARTGQRIASWYAK